MDNRLELYNQAKDAYYNGNPIMSDLEFDTLESELGLENKGYIGTHHQKSYTVKHPFLMGSLSKIQVKFNKDNTIHFVDYISQVKSYLDKSRNTHSINDWYFETTPKYDGCSWEAVIEPSTYNLISVSTRGDGKYGKNIKSWFEPYFNDVIKPSLSSFSTNNFDSDDWFYMDKFVIRGECLIKKSIFKEKYLGDFKMPRSFVAGCLGQDWENTPKQIEMRKDLSWVCYDYRTYYDSKAIHELDYSGITDNIYKQMVLPDYSYENIPGYKPSIKEGSMMIHLYSDINNFKNIYKYWEEYRKNCEFELDGFVIKPGAHFRLQDGTRTRQEDCVAIKFTPEIVDAKIIDIEWNVGKTGEYYPTGILDTILIGGKNVDRVSLANYDTIIRKKTGIGSKIRVSLAGDIIPFVYEVIEPDLNLNIPDDSYIENGHLMKKMNDDEKEFLKFINSIKVIKPNGIGESVAEKLYDIFQTDNILDFMIDDNQDWISQLDDSKSSINILKALDERKLTLSLPDIIQSLGYENCGEKNSIWLAKKISGINIDSKGIPTTIINLSDDDLFNRLVKMYMDKFNIDFLKEEKKSDLIPVIMTGSPKSAGYNTKSDFLNKHPEYVETSKWNECKILFTDDLNSNSSKMTKANKLGIKIKLYN